VLDVGLDVPAAYSDVIQIDEDESHAAGNVVHHALKRVSSIGQTKFHIRECIKAKRCDNCSFAYIILFGYLAIAFPEIHLPEDGAAGHPRGKVHHVGQGISIQDGDEVQLAVISKGLPAAILLPDHVQWRGPGTL